jgi:hypothetical protein
LEPQRTSRTYTRGFIDVIQNKADVKLDRLTLAPRFYATKKATLGIEDDGYSDNSEFGWMYKQGRGSSFNMNGASFIMHGYREWTTFHESLHGIFNRVAGRGNPWIDNRVFGSEFLDHGSRYYEMVTFPFTARLYPSPFPK